MNFSSCPFEAGGLYFAEALHLLLVVFFFLFEKVCVMFPVQQ